MILCGGTIVSVFEILLSFVLVNNDVETAEFIRIYCIQNSVGLIYEVENGLFRILFFGIIGQFVALAISLYYINIKTKRRIYYVCACVNSVGIIHAFTRGWYAAYVVLFIIVSLSVWLFVKQKIEAVLQEVGTVVLVSLVSALALSAANRTPVLSYACYRSVITTNFESIGEKLYMIESSIYPAPNGHVKKNEHVKIVEHDSITLRETVKRMLLDEIKKAPLVGNGLANAIGLRDGTVEMTFHDLVNKTGMVGLLAFFSPMIYITYIMIATATHGVADCYINRLCLTIALYGSFLGLCVASYSNPYLFSSLGIFLYCLLMLVANDAHIILE